MVANDLVSVPPVNCLSYVQPMFQFRLEEHEIECVDEKVLDEYD
jgi:hypothetical protein